MIKISRLSAPAAPVTRLRVEGRIVLRTASEVAHACHTARAEGPPVLLDLGGVAFVDAEGAAALAALERHDVTIVACSPFIAALRRSHAERSDETAYDADAALVDRLRADDPAAFEELVRRHGVRMLGVARRLLRDDVAAREAVAQALDAARNVIATLPADAVLAAWLHRSIAAIACRRLSHDVHAEEPFIERLLPRFDETGHWIGDVSPLALPSGAGDPGSLRAAVERAIDALPSAFRTILVLSDVELFDSDLTASFVGASPAAVRSRLHRARQALRTLLGRPDVDPAGTDGDGHGIPPLPA